MTEVTKYTAQFALVGLLFVGISIPLIKGKVPPNYFYGFRTAKTLSDPRIWYEANRISGQDLCIAGIFIAIASLIMMILCQGADPDHVVFTLLSVMVLSLAGVVWHGIKVVRRM